jgi:hypothetical protein
LRGDALKFGKEDDVIGPPGPILQPKGNAVIGPEPTKLGDGGVSFTLTSYKCVSGGEISVGNPKGIHRDGAIAPVDRLIVLTEMGVRVADVEVPGA